ncbi:putative lipid II flippase MurJ [Planctomycetales bacterium]|nr:putative lipid II flippase MurJ [Planctomycetales bacterium]
MLCSRILGMLRDIITASFFGISANGVMDAFAAAFRLPDIARKLFGDGSLSVSFIPVFSEVYHQDVQKSRKLLTAVLTVVFAALSFLILLGEVICLIGLSHFEQSNKVFLASHYLAVLLPYIILVGLIAITSAALQTAGHFTFPAFISAVLNIVWIISLLALAPLISSSPAVQCCVLTVSIVLAGLIQLFLLFMRLKQLGFKPVFQFKEVKPELHKVFSAFFPQLFGLMSVPLMLLTATVLAWFFSGPAGTTSLITGNLFLFPLRSGAVSAIYFSERLFEFPQGIIGLALTTVIYPLLSRHAAVNDLKQFGEDLSLGMRILMVLSIPAGIGLMMFSYRLAHLLFQRGAFTAADTERTGDMIFWFGTGVWAFCALPVVIRAFYLFNDIRTPLRAGLFSILFHIILSLVLIHTLKEDGLALSISITAVLQFLLLFFLFAKKHGYIDFKGIIYCIIRSFAAGILMFITTAAVMKALPGADSISDILHIVIAGSIGLTAYFVFLRMLGSRELNFLLFRNNLS